MENHHKINLRPFSMQVQQGNLTETISIQFENGVFEIVHEGRVLGALRPPGEDWQLLPYEQLSEEIALFEIDLQPQQGGPELHAALINEIIGEIENRLK
ncbi:hypothetical protein GCM10022289_26590 [Pedobacter jeongneungensis]|uniref:Uncharacterized protein n=1 Tax=Pedobacter jeongneungensis TaxID=947309 RepID=A0ABP8BGW6_9SPHI